MGCPLPILSWRSVVGIVTHYGLDGPGIEFQWRQDFPHLPRPALQASYRMGIVSFLGVKQLGHGTDHPPSSAEVKERVELYLYSPFGPSWPVLG